LAITHFSALRTFVEVPSFRFAQFVKVGGFHSSIVGASCSRRKGAPDNLSKAGWSWGCVATVDSNGRTIWVADAHRDDGKRFVVHADEKLTAFLELESAIRSRADCLDYPA
jgi:hypothetical protein